MRRLSPRRLIGWYEHKDIAGWSSAPPSPVARLPIRRAAPFAVAYYQRCAAGGSGLSRLALLAGEQPDPFGFDWTFDYYPLSYAAARPENDGISLTRLGAALAQNSSPTQAPSPYPDWNRGDHYRHRPGARSGARLSSRPRRRACQAEPARGRSSPAMVRCSARAGMSAMGALTPRSMQLRPAVLPT